MLFWEDNHTYTWEPGTYATHIMTAAYSSYVKGDVLKTYSPVIQEADGIMYVCFGRGAGHTLSIEDFITSRPDLAYAVIGSYMGDMQRKYIDYRHRGFQVRTSILSSLNSLRGYEADVIFIDHAWVQFCKSIEKVQEIKTRFHGAKIIAVLSDAFDTSRWQDTVSIHMESRKPFIERGRSNNPLIPSLG